MTKYIEGCARSVFYYVDGLPTSIDEFVKAEPTGFPAHVLRNIGKDTLELVWQDIRGMTSDE